MSDPRGARPPGNQGSADLLGPLRSTLSQAARWERYRVLASLLGELAETDAATENGRAGEVEQVEALTKKMQRLREEKAAVDDQLAAQRADLAAATKQAEVEATRAKELQRIVDDQRARMETTQKEFDRVEAELVQRNSELHRVEVQNEQLTVQLQRAQLAGGQTGRLNELEERIHNLTQHVKVLETEKEQLRQEKNNEIRRLEDQLAAGGGATAGGGGGEALLVELWERLIKAQLARGPVAPNTPAAERVFDSLIEFARFANDFDKNVRPFLASYTKFNPTVKRPWEVYTKNPELSQVVKETVAVPNGKPVGVLRVRLRGLMTWTMAGIIASDSALESIGDELREYLQGPVGMASDPNKRIKDFIKDDGHLSFNDRIRELRSQRLAEAYGHGV
jgi:hypothetical protein